MVPNDGRALYQHAQKEGWEGLIAKRADSTYQIGKRSLDWRKIKFIRRQEFVIGGWTEPRQSRSQLGTLLLGVYEAYQESMKRYCHSLNVQQLNPRVFRTLASDIKESGSDLPRTILAYFFSILQTIKVYGNFTAFPIVIDAPNQQEQDAGHIRRMLTVMRDDRPAGSQLTMGLVDDWGIEFDGSVIEMTEENYALRQEDYESLAHEMRPFSDAALLS